MTRSLNRIFLGAACAVTISLFSAAAVTVPTCASNKSMAFYITTYNGAGCQIGDKIFNNFSYGPSGSNIIPATDVSVLTLGPAGTGADHPSQFFPNDIGLQFDAPWVAFGTGTSSDGAIGFTVTIVNGSNMLIKDAGLMQGSGGPGVASVTESGCSGIVAPCTEQWGVVTNNTTFIANTIFTPTGSISVAKDILVFGKGDGTTPTQISIVQDVFSQTAVPEPRTTAVMLTLLAIGLVFRKKFQGARS